MAEQGEEEDLGVGEAVITPEVGILEEWEFPPVQYHQEGVASWTAVLSESLVKEMEQAAR